MNLLEKGIWEKIKDDDLKSFEILFDSYYACLCNYADDFLRNKEESEELVLELFLEIWVERSSITIHSSIKAYLYRSVHNRCLNLIKQNVNLRKKNSDFEEHFLREADANVNSGKDSALDMLIALELEEDIEKAISDLPGQCREIFYYRRFKQMKIKDIAIKLNISESTVKTQLVRAVDKLRESLKNHLS